MYPFQDAPEVPAPAPWQQQFASTFAWLAEHDPGYFTRLTWAEAGQQETVPTMLHAWLEEQAALGVAGCDQLRGNLMVVTLLNQHDAGQIDRDHLVVGLVGAVPPPWAEQTVARAFASFDQALGEEVARIHDPTALLTRLTEVFADEFALTLWSLNALVLANQAVEEAFGHFTAACEAHLSWYLPRLDVDVMSLDADLASLADQGVRLDYLPYDGFAQVLAECPELVACFEHYNDLVDTFNAAGPQQWQYQSAVLEAVELVHGRYAARQPAVLGHVAAFVDEDGRVVDPEAAQLAASIPQWEELRERCNAIVAQLQPGFTGHPPAEPQFPAEQVTDQPWAQLEDPRAQLPAPTLMTDAQWQRVVLAVPRMGVAEYRYDKRLVLDAIYYQRRTGCAWEQLPAPYPPAVVVSTFESMWQMERTFNSLDPILG